MQIIKVEEDDTNHQDSNGQHSGYPAVNEAQEQTLEHTASLNDFDAAVQMTRMAHQQMPQMQQTHHANSGAEYQAFPHERMVTEVNNFRHSMDAFNEHVNHFMYTMTRLADAMNARVVKSERERDELRAALSSHQPDTSPPAPQTAPEYGSRNSRFRDGEDMAMSSPTTPTRPPPLDVQFHSVPAKNNGERPAFGSKLTGTKTRRSEKTKARKDLQIKIPGKSPLASSLMGLPTPATRPFTSLSASFLPLSATLDNSPLTPGRIGPDRPSTNRSTNLMNKRKFHNLEKLLPAPNAVIPMLPLTDTEIIVYFFQSLKRPVVSLRLYARKWGPANIVDTLNEHRRVEGGYLRNTASVKCTTAIKRGKEMYGETWAENLRAVFAEADDVLATDMMQLNEEEAEHARDFDIAALDMHLKKHPQEGVNGGIFTRCVKYCVEHRAKYTLRNVHELAWDLRNGTAPGLSGRVDELEADDKPESDDQDAAADEVDADQKD